MCVRVSVLAAGIDPYDASATAPSEIVCFSASFHGRTMGALALTYKEQYKTPFAPVMPGAKLATYQDLDSAAKVIKKVSAWLTAWYTALSCLAAVVVRLQLHKNVEGG